MSAATEPLLRTTLHDLHVSQGARFVPFAGYEMPLQYPAGLMQEHLHTRSAASLFDCSHMGQVLVRPRYGDMSVAALALESVIPIDILGLPVGRQRYGFLSTPEGGLSDDLIVANLGSAFLLVLNASRKHDDCAHIVASIGSMVELTVLPNALLALQGPAAAKALEALTPAVAAMRFMDVMQVDGMIVTRSGYTGEDGYELSLEPEVARGFAEALLAQPEVKPAGLGARDTLRLEAGLCLYGSDIDATTSPIEAALGWAISPARRAGGAREGGYPGAVRILEETRNGTSRRRVGLRGQDRTPVRAGAPLFADEAARAPVGIVTSGGFSPTLQAPIAMGYLPVASAERGTPVFAEVRGRRIPLSVADLPFTPPRVRRA